MQNITREPKPMQERRAPAQGRHLVLSVLTLSGVGLWTVLFCALLLLGLSLTNHSRSASASDGSAGISAAKQARGAAVYQDRTGRELMLARMEFEDLGLKMIGIAEFAGSSSVYIEHSGSQDQTIYQTGDEIEGFTIVSIQEQYTVFERKGVQLWLAAGTSPGGGRSTGRQEARGEFARKTRGEDLKSKTHSFAEANIVDFFLDRSVAKPIQVRRLVATVGLKFKQTSISVMEASGRFIAPMRGRLTSGYGYRRTPMGGGRRDHRGIDIAAPYRTPVNAAAEGEVISVGRSWNRGRHVMIRHADGFSSGYFHLSKVTVETGEWVSAGEVIGLEGSTGISTGPHLHFEIHKNGEPVDPALYVAELARR